MLTTPYGMQNYSTQVSTKFVNAIIHRIISMTMHQPLNVFVSSTNYGKTCFTLVNI
jgi:hypothetical protein